MPEQYDIDTLFESPQTKLEASDTPSFGNTFDQGYSGARTNSQLKNYGVGTRTIRVPVGFNIQDAIDKVAQDGGGIVSLQNGTHKPQTNISLPSNVYLIGENAESAIIDFQDNTKSLQIIGTGAYTTGTISVTNNSTTVTGSGTLWSSNVVAGQNILLDGIWYPIAVVGSDTSITIAIPYGGADLSGASYTIATIKNDVKVENLSITNALYGIQAQYTTETVFKDLSISACAVGIKLDDSSQAQLEQCDAIANNTNYTFTNVHFTKLGEMGSVDALTGNGMTLDTVTNSAFANIFILNSAADGMNITNCSDVTISGVSSENGGQGIEFVSGNNNVAVGSLKCTGNASDGIRLTATSDDIRFYSSPFQDNGGYGINIVASSCDNTIIQLNNFSGNSSGAINDSGTNTMIIGNTPQSVQTGVYDFGGATSFEIPNGAAPTVDAAGEIAVDTTIADYTGLIKYHDGTEELSVVAMPTANLSTTNGDVVKYNATNNEFEMGAVSSGGFGGDGSDGALSTSGNVSLTRDMYYTTLTVNNGHTITTNGYRIFASTSITVASGGVIQWNGNNGSAASGSTGGAGGATLTAASLAGSVAGGVGANGNNGNPQNGAAGTAGSASTFSIGTAAAAGGAGGTGGSGTGGAGGAGGTFTASTSQPRASSTSVVLGGDFNTGTFTQWGSSPGGGGGGAGGNNDASFTSGGGGGGGSAGGVIMLISSSITVDSGGTIQSNGGNGGNGGDGSGGNNSGGGGGGAGGNGGVIILVTPNYSNNGTVQAAGGTGGAGGIGPGVATDGSAGSNGNPGSIYQVTL